MSYRFEYRDSFWRDYFEAFEYIRGTLENPIAAREMDNAFEREKRTLLTFPKASKPYASPPDTDLEYYALPVKNYFAFYVVKGNVIEFRRFLYSRSNILERLKN